MQVDQYSNWETRALNPKPSLRFVVLALSALALQPGLVRAQLQPAVNPLAGNASVSSGPQAGGPIGPGGAPLIFGDKVPERGWEGLANLLEAISPSVDTRVPLSATDIARRIESLLSAGRATQALEEIDKRLAAESGRTSPGTDVQIMFLRARTLAALDRIPEAEDIYRQMTIRFPELPEPWNNLAAIYALRDDLDQARRALEMAIMIYPDYGIALANLGDIQLKLALRAYKRAADLGVVGGVRTRIQAVNNMLSAQPGPADSAARSPAQPPAKAVPVPNPRGTTKGSTRDGQSSESTGNASGKAGGTSAPTSSSSNVTSTPETTAR